MNDFRSFFICFSITHFVLFLIAALFIYFSNSTTTQKKWLQAILCFFVVLIGPIITICIHLSDRLKPPPFDPNPSENKDNIQAGLSGVSGGGS